MKILSDEISTSASYTRIIFGLCFDKLPFELSMKRKVLTFTEVLKKLIFFMRVKELLSSQDSSQMNDHHYHTKISRRMLLFQTA